MLKLTLSLALFFISFSAFARYPDGQCKPTETKMIFESQIVFGKRVQLSFPLFCASGRYYPILAFDSNDTLSDHTSSLCALYQMGTTVTYDPRMVDHEILASFDEKGNFNGVKDFNIADTNEVHAVKSLTCQIP